MKHTILRAVAAGLCGVLLFCLSGCRGEVPPASSATVLLVMCETLPSWSSDRYTPDGYVLYSRAASPEGGDYLSDTLFSALFGEAARGLLAGTEDTPAAVNDAAVCLSVSPTPVELAVLRCSDARGAATAAGLCRARLDTVRRAWTGTEWEGAVEEGVVTVVGSYVLLVIAENPDRAADAARSAITHSPADRAP